MTFATSILQNLFSTLGCFCFHISSKPCAWTTVILINLHSSSPSHLPHTQQQIQMAEKMVQADMGRLIQSMKDCQKFQHMNVVQDYKKQILHNGHCLAQNAKSLFEVVTHAQAKLRWFENTIYIYMWKYEVYCTVGVLMTLHFVRFLEDNVNCNFLLFVCME